MNKFVNLEKKININFKNKKLLENVFVHRSYLNENKSSKLESNEKLEFLGDSVLSLITSIYLYKNYPRLNEGVYTDIKSSIVRTESLARAAVDLELGEYLYLSKGEDRGEGRKNTNILADTFEALIAAIFIDRSFDQAYEFVLKHLFQERLTQIIRDKLYESAKSKLQETLQKKFKTTPEYKVTSEVGPEHRRIFTVAVYFDKKKLAQGTGKTKKEAEEAAATKALLTVI